MISISEDSFSTGKSFLSKLEIRYYLIMCLPLIAFMAVYLKFSADGIDQETHANMPLIATTVFAVLGLMLAGMLIFRRFVKRMRVQDIPLKQKLVRYFGPSIWLYSWIELCGIVLVMAYYYTHAGYFAIAFGLHIIVISAERPTKHRLARHLRLKGDDRNKIIFEQSLD